MGRRIICGLLLGVLASSMLFAQVRSARNTGKDVTFEHADNDREYRIHVPKSYTGKSKVPLVVCLHGGGGNSEQASRMGLTPVADRHGFIVVYPNGMNKHWNDGRKSDYFVEQDATISDVDFITAIVERVSKEYSIDANKIFATGASNGGFMSQRLAIEKSEIFSAVGIVIASMGKPLSEDFAPEHPVSVLYMNGTQDPLVPYNGVRLKSISSPSSDASERANRKVGAFAFRPTTPLSYG